MSLGSTAHSHAPILPRPDPQQPPGLGAVWERAMENTVDNVNLSNRREKGGQRPSQAVQGCQVMVLRQFTRQPFSWASLMFSDGLTLQVGHDDTGFSLVMGWGGQFQRGHPSAANGFGSRGHRSWLGEAHTVDMSSSRGASRGPLKTVLSPTIVLTSTSVWGFMGSALPS